MEEARIVKLYGHLGEKYGREHRLFISSPAEAIRALSANFKDFKKDVVQDGKKYYKVFTGKDNKSDTELIAMKTSKQIRIVPVVAGAGGLGKIILGAALIVASFYLPTTALIGSASLSSIASAVGFSLLLGGVSQLLFSPPKPERYRNEAPENRPSYSFAGAINVTGQGNPIPVAYGGPIGVGSQVISVGLSVARLQ